jgi:hypothetical protein
VIWSIGRAAVSMVDLFLKNHGCWVKIHLFPDDREKICALLKDVGFSFNVLVLYKKNHILNLISFLRNLSKPLNCLFTNILPLTG